jgi:hypothetical protein
MIYSFSVRANTKAELPALIKAEFDKVVESQPTHAVDRQAAEDVANAFVAVVKDPGENESIALSVSGSVQWTTVNADVFNGAGVNVEVSVYVSPAVVA